MNNFVQELPHELENDLKLRILRSLEVIEKSQNWVGTQLSVQSFPLAIKNYAKTDLLILLYQIYFDENCHKKPFFALNLYQSFLNALIYNCF